MAFGPYIPALADGSATADGNPITHLGGFVHNDSEVSLIQTDADETVMGGATIWGDGVATWDKVSYADLLAHLIGTQNTWLKWVSISGVCHLVQNWQYLTTKELTEPEYNQNVRYVGGASCGGGIIPFEFSLDFSEDFNSFYLII